MSSPIGFVSAQIDRERISGNGLSRPTLRRHRIHRHRAHPAGARGLHPVRDSRCPAVRAHFDSTTRVFLLGPGSSSEPHSGAGVPDSRPHMELLRPNVPHRCELLRDARRVRPSAPSMDTTWRFAMGLAGCDRRRWLFVRRDHESGGQLHLHFRTTVRSGRCALRHGNARYLIAGNGVTTCWCIGDVCGSAGHSLSRTHGSVHLGGGARRFRSASGGHARSLGVRDLPARRPNSF